MSDGPPWKRCGLCGVEIRPEEWPALGYVGSYEFPESDEAVELRDCPGPDCRNTLSVFVCVKEARLGSHGRQ